MKQKLLVLFAILLVGIGANAQKAVLPDTVSDKAHCVPDEKPSYPGGSGLLFKYLSTQIRYPSDAVKNKIEGRVIITFFVEKDGSVNDVAVLKSVCPSLDKEAVRVVKNMAKWNPGKHKGVQVRVKYTLPISFRLPR